ncbi:hypothetical protein D2E76_15930 [Mycobacteroides abscessus]|uniref:Uncharacterized protein n=1 Tax=Mycobacteroides abscessus TaxID=36809 RepID=A0ABD7HM48_9MYCO|nr:hypothetical protein [Mycobacteroides abscessus]RIT36748.1 hypothetical protein D2E76_15930 [Mycobacteroides abscessus]
MSARYEAEVYREDGWWKLQAPKIKGLLVQTRRIEEILERARIQIAEAISVTNPDDIDVVIVDVQIPGPAGAKPRHLLEEIPRVRTTQRQLEEEAVDVVRDFLAELTDPDGPYRVPVRDLGFLMQFTGARISQLARESKKRKPADKHTPSNVTAGKPLLPEGLEPRRPKTPKAAKRTR